MNKQRLGIRDDGIRSQLEKTETNRLNMSSCKFPLTQPHLVSNSLRAIEVAMDDHYGRGRDYAVQFAQFIADNREWVGSNLLGHIVEDMLRQPNNAINNGYMAGFFSFLEYLIYYAAEHVDVSAFAKQVQDHYQQRLGNFSSLRMCDCD